MSQVDLCFKCKIIKPDRCFHCRKCSRCILKRDHHCPWFNRCIGFVNQKSFILFLVYFTILLAFTILSTFQYFVNNFRCLLNKQNGEYNYFILSYFILSAIVLVYLLLFTLNTLILASINATSIEFKEPLRLFEQKHLADRLSPFSFGNKFLNLAQIFGYNILTVFLPIASNGGDGYSWELFECSGYSSIP